MIVIPMAGASARFFEAGYRQPKYMLDLHGRSVFSHAVGSFSHYFESLPFLFIVRDIHGTPAFVEAQCEELGIADRRIVALDQPTRGQADTVRLGLEAAGRNQALTIFNVDTFRPEFRFPALAGDSDGYLEVFEGSGSGWSFVRAAVDDPTRVVETTEKRPISNLCSTGLYHFQSVDDFMTAFEHDAHKSPAELQGGELYVAPLYNHLIEAGRTIRFDLIRPQQVIFCGVPGQYEKLKARWPDPA